VWGAQFWAQRLVTFDQTNFRRFSPFGPFSRAHFLLNLLLPQCAQEDLIVRASGKRRAGVFHTNRVRILVPTSALQLLHSCAGLGGQYNVHILLELYGHFHHSRECWHLDAVPSDQSTYCRFG
jgi:hypothetical protein